MSNSSSKKWKIILCLSGVSFCGYVFYKIYVKYMKVEDILHSNKIHTKEKNNKEKEELTESLSKNKNQNHTTIKSTLEITTNISLDLNKKMDFNITKQVNLFYPSEIIKQRDTSRDLVIEGRIEEGNLGKQRIQSPKTPAKKYKLEDERLSLNNQPINLNSKCSLKSPTIEKIDLKLQHNIRDKVSNDVDLYPNANNTIINIVKNMRSTENINSQMKHYTKNNFDNQESIYLPILTHDIGDEFLLENDEGYLEDDDEDLKELEIPSIMDPTNDNNQEFKDDQIDSYIVSRKISSEELIFISSADQIKEILTNKNFCRLNKNSYNIMTESKIRENNTRIDIIKGDLLLVILQYLYSELNSLLIELSDNFVEQRRYYLESDHSTYVSIINLFLRKKEEIFLGVLSEIMSKLNITQNLLDDTFVYYMNIADKNDKLVLNIQSAYDKIYKAGMKKTIAPKKLTKEKLKEILEFQYTQYEDLLKIYNYKIEVIQIMVVDITYLEFGLDKETIRAAMNKHSIYGDEDFKPYLSKIKEYEKNTFLNI